MVLVGVPAQDFLVADGAKMHLVVVLMDLQMVRTAEALVAQIASVFESGKPVNVGDVVVDDALTERIVSALRALDVAFAGMNDVHVPSFQRGALEVEHAVAGCSFQSALLHVDLPGASCPGRGRRSGTGLWIDCP